MLAFYTEEDLQVFKYQVFIILRKLQIAEYFIYVALIVFKLFVTNAHRSGAGHVTTHTYTGYHAEPTGPVPASCPRRNRFPYYFVTSSHLAGAGHVTTQTYTGYQSLLVW